MDEAQKTNISVYVCVLVRLQTSEELKENICALGGFLVAMVLVLANQYNALLNDHLNPG